MSQVDDLVCTQSALTRPPAIEGTIVDIQSLCTIRSTNAIVDQPSIDILQNRPLHFI